MTGGHDPLTEFYIPALTNSNTYWRASGYFSSSVFDSIGDTMGEFVQNDGRMDLVTSVHLSQKDRDAIESGLKDRENLIEERLKTPRRKSSNWAAILQEETVWAKAELGTIMSA